MSDIVSHNTEGMRNWSEKLIENSNYYDELVNSMYTLVNQFVGSEMFKGGLSTDFEDAVLNAKPEFDRYSSTFNECAEYIKSKATQIDSDEEELKAGINAANPMG